MQVRAAIATLLVLLTIACSRSKNKETIHGNWFFITDYQYEEEYLSDSLDQFMLTSAGLLQETKYTFRNDTIFYLLLGKFVPVSRIIKLTKDSLIVELVPVEGFQRIPTKSYQRKMKRLESGEMGYYDFPADSSRKSKAKASYYRRYYRYYLDQRLISQEQYDSLERNGAF